MALQGADTDIVYHASGTQVHFMADSLFKKKAIIVEEYVYQLPREDYNDLLKFCMQNAGVDYGQVGVLGIAAVKFAEMVGFTIKNPFNSARQWCSKLVGALIKNILNVEGAWRIEVGTAGPSDINKFIASRPELFKKVLILNDKCD